jgi:pilus assembly protein FimV
VLPDDYAVQTFGEEDEPVTLRDNDKTMLASSLSSDDFDFAKTEALPPGTYPGDDEVTGELPAIGSTDVDLDLDDLTEALKRSEKGDTVEQPRDDKTVEHRRPVMGDDTAETSSFAPEDISNDLEDARTMTEVGTKLDLARAYVDMGDPAGARSILEEVLDEGDSSQRQQAQKLLDSLPG